MLYALESGCAWRLLPTQFGPPDLVETRFRRWVADAVFRRAYHELYPAPAWTAPVSFAGSGVRSNAHPSALGTAPRPRLSGKPEVAPTRTSSLRSMRTASW